MAAPRAQRRPQPAHGGRREGAGHPVTTGAASTAPVSFRVSADERQRGEQLAEARGLKGINALARAAYLEALAKG